MTTIDLSQGWSLAPGDISCAAPCSVLSVLSAAGRIPDPLGGAEMPEEVRAACAGHWTFTRIVQADEHLLAHEAVALEFDAIDTLATVTLGGRTVLRASSAYRPWAADVRSALRPGRNILRVKFEPATPENSPGKPPLAFGASWSPPLPDCGIAGPVRLRAWNHARIAELGFGQRHLPSGPAELLVGGWIESTGLPPDAFALRIRVRAPDGGLLWDGQAAIPPAVGGAFHATVPVPKPKLWWPSGLGEQPLYRVDAALFLRDGRGGAPERLDARAFRIGLRTLAPVTTEGGRSALSCNGRVFFPRGAVWAPPPPCTGEKLDRAATEPALASARDANFNAFLLAPGAPPPPPAFWNLCDAYGMVVLGTAELGHRAEAPGAPSPAFLHHACVPDSIVGEPDEDSGLEISRSMVSWPDSATLAVSLPSGERSLNGPAAARRCALRAGPAALIATVAQNWPLPRTADFWPRLTQLAAAASLRRTVAQVRTGGTATGFFFEPFQSAWACADASALDHLGNPKATLHEAARCYAPEALFAWLGHGGAPEATYVNDTPAPRRNAALSWRLAALDGETLAQGETAVTVGAFETRRLALPDVSPWLRARDARDVALWLAVRDGDGFVLARDCVLFAPPCALRLPDPGLSVSVSQLPDEGTQQVFRVSVSASAAAFGVHLEARDFPALWDDNDLAIDPDETVEILATPLRRIDPVRFAASVRATSLADIIAR